MPDLKISELTAEAGLSGTEVFPAAQAGANTRVSVDQVKNYTLADGAAIEAALDTEIGNTDWKTAGGTPTDGSVTNAKMADDSVGADELIANSVGTAALAPGAVTANELSTAFKATVEIDASGFSGNLTTTDDTVQEIADKLDALATGSGSTNLGYVAATRTVTSSSGTDVVIPEADGTNAGLMSDADKDKLDKFVEAADGFSITGGTTARTLTITGDDITLNGGAPNKGDILVGDAGTNYDAVSVGTDNQMLVADAAQARGLKYVDVDSSINFVIDGGGSAITTGVKGSVRIDFDCVIEEVSVYSPKESGDIVVDIWKDTHANFPATDGDSITAAAPATLSAAQASNDATLTGWTTAITAGDHLIFNVDSAATTTNVTVDLKVRRVF